MCQGRFGALIFGNDINSYGAIRAKQLGVPGSSLEADKWTGYFVATEGIDND